MAEVGDSLTRSSKDLASLECNEPYSRVGNNDREDRSEGYSQTAENKIETPESTHMQDKPYGYRKPTDQYQTERHRETD